MTPQTLTAGIDVGTTHVKVGCFDDRGGCVAAVRRVTPRDLRALVAAVTQGLEECTERAGRAPQAIGITGMAETGVPLDVAGQPLTPLLWWNDPRGAAELAELDLDPRMLYARTGRWPDAKAPLAKWLWLRRHAPEVWRAMRWWASVPDAVAYALTGQLRTHATLAARTLGYSVEHADYDAELLALAGLSRERMPAVHAAVEPVGGVVARVRGVPPGTPVVVAGHDHAVGAWAAGVRRPGDVADSLGTAEAVLAPSARRPDPGAGLALGVTADPSLDGARTVLVGGLATSGAVVDWLLDLLSPAKMGSSPIPAAAQEMESSPIPATAVQKMGSSLTPAAPAREVGSAPVTTAPVSETGSVPVLAAPEREMGSPSSSEAGASGYAALPRLLADVQLPTGIVVEPYLRGRAAPAPDRDRRMTWAGIGAEHGVGDLLAAAIEGTCLHTRWILDELTALTGTVPERVAVFGGQVRIPLWMRVKAAVSPVPVEVIRADDAVCAGAALVAGQVGGSLDDVPLLPREHLPPDPALQAAYLPLYDQFRTRSSQRQEHA
ncbi:FGGY-family carbohydrate kinase [[Actinomadura] parvosata]|uniref:FGGY-family carbohydrate kinase n=1 Tax=[Actinomadura] parvosata TaxID=1955412 RepID=UPI00406C9195